MRILITGSAGLCGSHLVQELIDGDGLEVVFGVDNFTRGYPCGDRYKVPLDWGGKFKLLKKSFHELTIRELNNLELDVVVHLAAFNSCLESMETPGEYLVNNDYGTFKLLQKLNHTKKTPFFIFASTVEVYGRTTQDPVTEASPISSLNVFAATKQAGEGYCSAFTNWYNYPLTILRFSSMYGENENLFGYSSLVCDYIARVLRDEPIIIYGCGNQLRDYLYAKDAAKAIARIINQKKAALGQVFNIASGNAITIEELANKIVRLTGVNAGVIKLPANKGDFAGCRIDTAKARELLAWSPKTELEQGLINTIRWHKKVNKM